MKLFEFLGSSAGRVLRGVAGLILIALGIWIVQGAWGWVLIIVGLVPLAAGIFDFCLFAPLLGLPFVGQKLRDKFQGPRA